MCTQYNSEKWDKLTSVLILYSLLLLAIFLFLFLCFPLYMSFVLSLVCSSVACCVLFQWHLLEVPFCALPAGGSIPCIASWRFHSVHCQLEVPFRSWRFHSVVGGSILCIASWRFHSVHCQLEGKFIWRRRRLPKRP